MTPASFQGGGASPPPGLRISRGKRLLAALITMAGVLILGILVLEAAFRLFVPVTDIVWTFWDPVTGERRHPGQVGRYIRGPINAPYHFNAQGWNHPEDYVLAKPEGWKRVCLVGDSMVEAKQVAPELSMVTLSQQRMSRPGRPVQWYGFGMAGWGPSHEHQAIKHYVMDYSPDVVILMFVQNDPVDSSPYLTKIEDKEPEFTLDESGELVFRLPRYMAPHWRGRIALKSSLLRYFLIQKGLWARMMGDWRRHRLGDVPVRAGSTSVEEGTPHGRLERQRKTWELLEKIIASTRDLVRARGATFAIAFRGHFRELDAAVRGETYEAPPKEVDPYCMGPRLDEMGREFVEPMADRLGVPYIDLTGPLLEMIRTTGQNYRFPNENHYNGPGHEAASAANSGGAVTLWPGVDPAGPSGPPPGTAGPGSR